MAKQIFTVGQVLTAAQLTSLQQTAMLGGAASAKTASYTLVAADAGTTISMTSTSATTITVNTGLFAAGDTVFIQNLGTGNLTITAGSATVASAGSLILPQNDAGILYFVSTGASVFYDFIQVGAASPLTTKGDLYTFSTSDTRLPVGANGTVLTCDSSESTGLKFATPAGGGKVLQVVSATTSTNVSIASTTYTATGLNATITPTLNTSKILILACQAFLISNSPDNGTFGAGFKLDRNIASAGANVIYTCNDSNPLFYLGSATQQMRGQFNASFLDSPATTSSCNYRTISQTNSTASGQNVAFQMGGVATSSMILLEIGA